MKISLQQARDTAALAVQDRGSDYVYPEAILGRPHYFREDGSPSCLVGWVLNYLGMSPIVGAYNIATVDLLITNADIVCDLPTRSYLEILQSQNDQGAMWGHALNLAEATLQPTTLVVVKTIEEEKSDENLVLASV